jgi:hypothetical protein
MEALLDISETEGEEDAERALCYCIGVDLMQTFPGYVWNVGFTRQAGVVTIKLVVPLSVRPNGMGEPGYLLYASTAVGPGGVQKVRNAAGEILERWGLPREKAPADWVERAWENGLDRSHMILKSNH